MIRTILFALLFLIAAGVGYLSFQWYRMQQNTQVASYGAPFTLIDQNGQPFTQDDLNTKPSALFFGFTHCPQICPTTLYELTALAEQLGTDAEKLQTVFVTVDPERDTPEVMKLYLSNVSARTIGLSGKPEDVMAMTKAYGIYSKKVPLDDGDYTMDHTASVILLDGNGDFFGTIAYEENTQTALAKLQRLVAKGS
ncbi:SCO family protein [Limoniibacter endophyticus]|uniref:Electron transporter SCO1/SenC n=1 Tax=Limoniibacter endophyticus TaxID=1565040 RepID=A0A8J3DIM6_9HYPH|nr:SCO family protein [Limoniibacter endophyticus]GHC75290.1 electron transporter SCO1/SenC [Limoniibacter endophyticus]